MITQVAGAKVEIATVMERVMETGVTLTKDAVEDVNPDVVRRYGVSYFGCWRASRVVKPTLS